MTSTGCIYCLIKISVAEVRSLAQLQGRSEAVPRRLEGQVSGISLTRLLPLHSEAGELEEVVCVRPAEKLKWVLNLSCIFQAFLCDLQ